MAIYLSAICHNISAIPIFFSRTRYTHLNACAHIWLQRYNFFLDCANILCINFDFYAFLSIIPPDLGCLSIFPHNFSTSTSFSFTSMFIPSIKMAVSSVPVEKCNSDRATQHFSQKVQKVQKVQSQFLR